MAQYTYKQFQKKRRGRTLAAQCGLGALIVVLALGVSYASVCILHGQAVLPALSRTLAALLPAPQDGPAVAVSAPEKQPDASPAGAPADAVQLLSADWNTAVPLAHLTPTVSDTRLLAVPENGRVSDDYFRDALFIGDSVTQGFGWYAEYKDWMRVCAYKGVGPNNVLQNMVGLAADGETSVGMWDDISAQQDVANIYILFGANALLAQSDEAFLKYYGDLLDRLRERFPDAPVYVQSITPTTQAYGQQRAALERDHLRLVNEAVAQLALSRNMYYIDLWEVMADADGYLRADLAGTDGLHLYDASKYRPWLDYLATHTVYSAHNAQFALEEGGRYS